jgi:hypothetical protein
MRRRAGGREQQDLLWSGSPLVLRAATEVGVSVRLVNANVRGGWMGGDEGEDKRK